MPLPEDKAKEAAEVAAAAKAAAAEIAKRYGAYDNQPKPERDGKLLDMTQGAITIDQLSAFNRAARAALGGEETDELKRLSALERAAKTAIGHDYIITKGGNIVEPTKDEIPSDDPRLPKMDANGDDIITGAEIESRRTYLIEAQRAPLDKAYGVKVEGVKSWLGGAELEIAKKLKDSGMAIKAADYEVLENKALTAVRSVQTGRLKEEPDVSEIAAKAFKDGFKELEDGHKLVPEPVKDAAKAASDKSAERK